MLVPIQEESVSYSKKQATTLYFPLPLSVAHPPFPSPLSLACKET